MFQIIAVMTVKESAVEDFKPLIAPLVAGSLKDRGNHMYEFRQDALNPCVFVVLEKWESDASLEEHTKQPHFTDFVAKAGDMFAAPMALHKLML